MRHISRILIASGACALLGACASMDTMESDVKTGEAEESVAMDNEMAEEMVATDAFDQAWPPAGCPDEAALKTWLADPVNKGYAGYVGVYSGDENPAANGNLFWLGFNHGQSVLSPNVPVVVKASPQGQGFVLRWNISDTYPGANQTVGSHYRWDYDKARDGAWAVNAIALNICETDQFGNAGSCQQPMFGTEAWKNDIKKDGLKEFCPPIIMSDDPSSIYVYDKNNNSEIEVYEYSLGLVMTAGGPKKTDLRIVIDPRVTNGGVGTINK